MGSTLKTSALMLLAAATLAALTVLFASRSGPDQAPAAGPQARSDYLAFVPSMLGTRPDGQISQQGPDQLVLSPELVYLFDYYLAAQGEQPLAAIRQQLRHELASRLHGRALTEAQRLLDAYIGYKRALADTEAQLPASKDLLQSARQRLYALQQTRAAFFSSSESAALFGASDAYHEDAIARMEISNDRQLTPAQRQQRWQQLDARLTPAQRAERTEPARVLALEQSVAEARQRGADENDIYRLRAAAFSPAAADRFAELDKEETAWQRRIADYQARRRALLALGGDQSEALEQLRATQFSASEQLRLTAYEP